MSRRRNRKRRAERKARDRSLPPAPPQEPMAPDKVHAKWMQVLRNTTFRGSKTQPFANLAFLPFSVSWNLDEDDPPRRAGERAVAALVRRTLEQKPS